MLRVEPASPAQEGMWFLHQLAPSSPFYNVPMAVAFETNWAAARVRRALQALVARHDALRVSYSVDEAGTPRQVIADELILDIPHTRLRRGEDLDALAQSVFQAPFDLARGPLLRAHMVTTGPGAGVALLTLHHSICDHWSLNVLGRELRALVRGERLPPPAAQYTDFARWQHDSLRGGELAAQLRHWRRRLAGAPPVIDLPLDRPRRASTSFAGGTRRARLGPRLTTAVERLARAEGATVFMTLLAAFDLLLHRFGRQSDIVVGTWIAGRNRTEYEAAVGAFANTLLVRADLHGDPTFSELVGHVRERVLEALANQDVRIETLVRELAPARTASHMPLCQVVYTHQNLPEDTLAARRGRRRRGTPAVDRNSTKYDLVLFSHGEGSAEGLELRLEYSSELFDDATAGRLLDAFERILEQVAEDPGLRAGEVEVMPPDERRRLVVDWNRNEAAFARRATLSGLYREQARRAPAAVALRHRGRAITAAELDAAADRVAHRLRRRGIGAGAVVGVCGPRSPEVVAGMLGAMRVGAAYLPLDPAYPAERIQLMLDDSGARVVLTFEDPPVGGAVPQDPLDGCFAGRRSPAVDDVPADIAYVVYTSGSTGRPKGVLGRHRATVNRLTWQWRTLTYSEGEVCIMKTATSFVDSVAELFAPLLRGVPLIVADDSDARDPFRLLNLLAAERVTRLVLVPSLLRSLLEVAPDLAAALPELRHWVTSGEALGGDLAARFLAAHPGARLFNLYGSSEVAGDATWHEVAEAQAGVPVPIGRPLANTSVFVLDGYRRPVPIGSTGEIWVGGEGLAAGYLGQPELTAERFQELDLDGSRVRAYRTGDLGRFRRDGVLVHAGRADHQLKIRGARVEPGEVEGVLRQVEGVAAAIVVGRGAGDDLRLVAYLETAAGRDAIEAAREAAERRLPAHARPSVYVTLRALPLTPNGKVNRLALPPPPDHDARAGTRYEPPRSEREAILAGIFASVLDVAEVGVHDDFFALGGHSLTATQAIARVRAALGVEAPLAALFEAPTVAGLAERLDAAQEAPPSPPLEAARLARAPLSFAQRRLWFLDQLQPGSQAYHIAQSFRFAGTIQPATVERALNEIVARHEVLRTTFAVEDGEPVQVVAPELRLRLRAVDLRRLSEEERDAEARRLARENFVLPFDLARGPLVRAVLATLGESDHLLFLCVHHAVTDGWSMEVLDAELRTLVAAFSLDRPAPLPPLPVQYADFARWQREQLRGENLERELGYWRQQLAGAPALLNLPTDRPRPAVQSQKGSRLVRVLRAPVRRALADFTVANSVTTFMALLAAFAALLARWSGQEDLVIGSPVAGRTRVELESLIGFFVNTVALRADVSGDPTFADLVERIRGTALDAYEHQDLPFERLVEEVAPDRDLSRSPLFQVMFVLQNTRRAAAVAMRARGGAGTADLRRVHWDVGAYASKFDLTLTVFEQPKALRLQVEFTTDLFDAATIGRFLDHFEVLLEAALAAPATPVSRLPLLKAAERAQLESWGRGGDAPGSDACLHRLFVDQVRERGDAVAVVHEGERVTYRELDRRANRLANHLAGLGVGHGDRVGIRLQRSPEMVEAVLAALKLGAAYVPLDPAAPPARGRFILEDSGARACVGDLEGAPCPVIDPRDPRLNADSAARPRARVRPGDVAYILYTSGSTGRPKGVLVEHRNVVSYCRAVAEATGATAIGIRYAMLQPLHVDSSVTALWGALLGGGELHLVTPETAADPTRLAGLLRRERIDHLKIAPSHLRALHAAGDPRRLMPRRWLVIGGEGSPWEWVRTLPALRRGCRVFNHYGPTEATVGVTVYPINANAGRRHDITPIGRPLPNSRAYVLDRHQRPQPVGVPGELYLGGDAVARGYCGRPELDAERFLPDPFAPGGRMYRTGDLCRWLPSGDVEFLGRLDHQVKIRGFRIELGEIEAALNRHPRVSEGLVQARDDARGDKQLVAWVAGRPGAAAPSAAELRTFLRRDLPEAMIPAAFVILDRMPLTPHGKVDLQALPAPRLEPPRHAVAPLQTDSERALEAIWRDVLGVETVGADGHFFELGGHSLLATQMISRVRDRFHVEVPLRAIFEQPTLAGLAGVLDELRN